MAVEATFITVWDDGAFSIESKCEVDFDSMEIVSMDEAHVAWDEDGNPTYDENEIDVIFNTVDHLDEEYVETEDEQRYTAAREGDLDAEDKYGCGIVVYRQ